MVHRVLITGASGYLGQHLVDSLLTKPPKIIGQKNKEEAEEDDDEEQKKYALFFVYGGKTVGFACNILRKHKDKMSPQIELNIDKLDVTDEKYVKIWLDENKPFHMCIHLAAMSTPSKCQESSDMAHKLNNPKAFFTTLKEINPNIVMVALSTDQVYDGNKGSPYIEANDEVGPVNVYSETKVAMETSLKQIFPRKQLFILRSSIICGSEGAFGNAHKTFLHFCSTRNGQETDFFTDECRSIVSVSDVVDVIRCIISNFVDRSSSSSSSSDGSTTTPPPATSQNGHDKVGSSIYNMGGKDRVSRYDIAMAVFRRFGYDTKCIVAKEKASLPVGNVPSPLDITMDSTKLEKCVGFSFKGLDDIVKETFPTTTTKTSETAKAAEPPTETAKAAEPPTDTAKAAEPT